MKAPIAWISLRESKGLAQPTSTEGDEKERKCEAEATRPRGGFGPGGGGFVQTHYLAVAICLAIRCHLKRDGRARCGELHECTIDVKRSFTCFAATRVQIR